MGDSEHWANFAAFVEAIAAAPVECDGLEISYQSLSRGRSSFSWQGPLRVAGEEIAVHDYPRFDNPYCQAEFGTTRYQIDYAGEQIRLDFSESSEQADLMGI